MRIRLPPRAVLKITFDGDRESVHEGLVLQRWHGDGAVRLLRACGRSRARVGCGLRARMYVLNTRLGHFAGLRDQGLDVIDD